MFHYFKNRLQPKKDMEINIDETVSFNEILAKRVIDRDLQLVLRPLNAMLFIFFNTKYSIRNNVVSGNYIACKIFFVIWVLISESFCLYRLTWLFKSELNFQKLFYRLTNCVDLLIIVLGHALCTSSMFLRNYDDTLMLFKIQYVFRVLQIDRERIKNLIKYYWIIVIVLIIIIVSALILQYCMFLDFQAVNTIYASFLFDVSIVYTFLMLKLLKKIIKVWIDKVEQSRNIDDRQEMYWNVLSDVYLKIQEIYMHLNKISRYVVSFYCDRIKA